MFLGKFIKKKMSQKVEMNDICAKIIETSSPDTDFYIMVTLSSIIVSLGLLGNNNILVIGGMLVTPLLSPILAIALGIVAYDFKAIFRSIKVFIMSFILTCLVSLFVGIIIDFNIYAIELINIMKPSLYIFIVAVVAGIAASYAWAEPEQNSTIPGTAIAVTLVPPLTATGLALASQNLVIALDVISVLGLNVLGILISSIVVFMFKGFYKVRRKIKAEIKEEEKEFAHNLK